MDKESGELFGIHDHLSGTAGADVGIHVIALALLHQVEVIAGLKWKLKKAVGVGSDNRQGFHPDRPMPISSTGIRIDVVGLGFIHGVLVWIP